MGDGDHLAKLIDAFLEADKALAGRGEWQQTDDPRELRISWPVLMAGETHGQRLEVSYYANERPPEFTIGIYSPRAVFRLDFEPHGGHKNPFNRPPGLALTIRGSHVHRWQDNRHLCTASALPQRLRVAREIPPQVQGLGNAFRWFCGEAKITLRPEDVPDTPRPDRLL